jgi:predicted methyltransferase
MRRLSGVFLMVLLTVILGASLAPSTNVFAAPQQHQNEPPPPDPTLQKMQKAADKQRNEQRQSDLKRDTEKLYQLASELKKSVENTNEHVLSLDVIKKSEEIEKLAHSVHEKMKAEGYGPALQ